MKRITFSSMALLLGSVIGCGGGTTTNTDPCLMVTCSASQFCDGSNGMCRDAPACASVTCGAATVCDGKPGSPTVGTCIAVTCGATACMNGQVCNQSTATCVNPGLPALGVQIDRMGRPAVNTALTNPFDFYPNPNFETSDTTKARYNSDSAVASWGAVGTTGTWDPAIAFHLGIIDGLDKVVNNAGTYDMTNKNYGFGAQLLAQDYVFLDTTAGLTCKKATATIGVSGYLHIEASALGKKANTDCGGRQLDDDTLDSTYGFLAGSATQVSDGIAFNAGSPILTAFPWSAAPL